MHDVLLRSVLAGAVLLSSTLSVDAGGCGYQSYSSYSYPVYTPYVEKVVEKRVVAVEYLAVPVVVPAYAIGYAAPAVAAPAMPAPAAAPMPCESKLAELNARFAALEAKLAGAAPPVQPLPQQAPAAAPAGKSAFVAKCAGCHDVAVAKTKGGKHEFFQNGLPLPLTGDQTTAALKQMMAGKMPKGGTLTDQEFTAILSELVGK